MTFPRFGPNGAHAFFSDERDVPPGWQPTAEDARRMQTLAPPPFAQMDDEKALADDYAITKRMTMEGVAEHPIYAARERRLRKGRRK